MTEYNNTFIGRIPVSWKLEKLKNLSTKITDGAHKTPKYIEKGIPFLRVTDIKFKNIKWNNTKHVSKEEHDDMCKRCHPEKNDILYSKNGTIGIPKIIDWDTEFSIFVSLCLIKPKHDLIYNKFLEQYLKSTSCKKQIDLRAKQGAVTNLHLEEIKEIEIPVPPILEQKKIAKILSKVDNHIDEVDGMIEDLKELKKGLMHKLLTEGIGHTEFKDSPVGRIPVEWEVKTISEIGEVVTGSTPKKSMKEYYGNEYSWVSPADLGKHKYISCSKTKLSEKGYEKCRKLPKGSILVTCIGSIGKMGLVLEELASNQQINAVKCNNEVSNEYVYYAIDYNFLRFKDYISRQVVPIINKTTFSKFEIAIPPKAEQLKIANIISQIDNRIEKFEIKRADIKELKRGLMQQLLTGKTRVKID